MPNPQASDPASPAAQPGSSSAPTALSFRDAWGKDSYELGEWLQQLPPTLIIFPRATGPLLPYKRSTANLGTIKHDISASKKSFYSHCFCVRICREREKLIALKWESSYASRALHCGKRMRLPQGTSISYCLWPVYFAPDPNGLSGARIMPPPHLQRAVWPPLSTPPASLALGHREYLVSSERPILLFFPFLSVTTCSNRCLPFILLHSSLLCTQAI